MNDLANAYVGRPYRDLGRGPDAFDCWGLVLDASARLYGVTLPDLQESVAKRRRWRALDQLVAGAVVAMLDRRGRAYHVGLAIGPAYVLHTAPISGARIESVDRMARFARAHSWRAYAWNA
jgi:cell wall-associated NlpC family hydrolase